jgi:putative DNA primase/helicase
MLKPKRIAKVDQLDAVPHRVTAPNGVLDLNQVARAPMPPEHEEPEEKAARVARDVEERAAWLLPHDRADKGTRKLGAKFDPAATCPGFDAFLTLIMPNEPMRAFLLRCFSLALFGRNNAQIALLLRGEGGNGKSTLVNAIAHVLGDYTVSCRIELFLAA